MKRFIVFSIIVVSYMILLSDEIYVSADDEIIQNSVFLTKYPNPFNPTTTISFLTTENTENTELSVYNLKGQKVKTLVNGILEAGQHSVVWNGTDDAGKNVSSGMYFVDMRENGRYTSVKKVILLK